MEIRIGIRDLSRDVTLESDEAPDAVLERAKKAMAAGEPLLLEDSKGRQILVPTQAIGFIDVGATERGRVGFAPL